MSTIGFMMHIPKLTPQYQDRVFFQMRTLLDVCEEGLPFVGEEWSVVNDHSGIQPTWRFAPEELPMWHIEVAEMQDRCCVVFARANFAMKIIKPRILSLVAIIRRSSKSTTPMIKDECSITGSFDKQVWDKIDQAKLRKKSWKLSDFVRCQPQKSNHILDIIVLCNITAVLLQY